MKLRLESACQKLDRALFHLNSLGDEMEVLAARGAANFVVAEEEVQSDPRGAKIIFRPGNLTRPQPYLGVIVGDYIHNLRSALDHLAWEMAKCGTEGFRTQGKRATTIQFPIETVGSSTTSRRTFSSEAHKRLPGITADQRAFVDSYQPYHRGNWQLKSLARLSNHDKHRVITPVRLIATKIKRRDLRAVPPGRILAWKAWLGRSGIDHDTPFMEVIVDSRQTKVIMNTHLQSHVAFREPPSVYRRLADLEAVGEVVAEILGESAKRWGSAPALAEGCAAWATYARAAVGIQVP